MMSNTRSRCNNVNICSQLKKRFALLIEFFGVPASDMKINEDHQKQDIVINSSTTALTN